MPVERDLLDYWQVQDEVALRPPASETTLCDFEYKYGVRLPSDLRKYFTQADGFDQMSGYQDNNGFNFWPLGKIEPVAEHSDGQFAFNGSEAFFLFADYLDFCWAYAIRMGSNGGPAGSVVIVGTETGEPLKIADSFSEFVALYINDESQLYP